MQLPAKHLVVAHDQKQARCFFQDGRARKYIPMDTPFWKGQLPWLDILLATNLVDPARDLLCWVVVPPAWRKEFDEPVAPPIGERLALHYFALRKKVPLRHVSGVVVDRSPDDGRKQRVVGYALILLDPPIPIHPTR
jgi:hypothetical protein